MPGTAKVILVCQRCEFVLTYPCALVDDDAYDRKADQGNPVIARGRIAKLPPNFGLDIDPSPVRAPGRRGGDPGAYACNPEDVIEGVLHKSGIDNGCCGSDGLDGPNRSCLCGLVLGTQWSDCWTQAEMRFEGKSVRVVPD